MADLTLIYLLTRITRRRKKTKNQKGEGKVEDIQLILRTL